MIRRATQTDVPALVAMGRRFLAESAYGQTISGDPDRMADLVTRMVASDTAIVLVSERDGTVTGMFGAFLFEHPMSGQPMATEMFWWVNPEQRGADGVLLLKKAERLAKQNGAEALQMIAPTPDVEAIYQRLGYSQVEVAYQRAL